MKSENININIKDNAKYQQYFNNFKNNTAKYIKIFNVRKKVFFIKRTVKIQLKIIKGYTK